MTDDMKNLIIIGGAMGVGKTSACRELQKILPCNVFLDGDWCWDMRPFIVTDETMAMVRGNITYPLNSFLRCAEFENIIFCWVLHKQEILNDLLHSLTLDTCAVHCFSLICAPHVLAERLNRDIIAGRRESGIIERGLERLWLYDALDTIKIDVSNISALAAAKCIEKFLKGNND
jgi:chloramphenicol 3-O-phosphotransferase